MKNDYLDYIILLEKTLASFYENKKNTVAYLKIKSVLEFMETHSLGHAEAIMAIRDTCEKPELDVTMIINYQNEVTGRISRDVSDESDLLRVLELMAGAEEKLGDLYNTIADTTDKLSEYYKKMAADIRGIAKEEYAHRDLLLKDRERLGLSK